MNKINRSIHTAQERIASGKRINSAKDDASGLAIAQRLTSMSEGLLAATRNANDAISMVQTAESGMSGITENLQRMRELSIQAANGTLSDADRGYIQSEVNALKDEINRVVDTTSFGGRKLLNTDETLNFQVGSEAGDTVSVEIGNMGEQMQSLGIGAIDLSSAEGANNAIGVIDQALEDIASTQAELGAVQNRFESTINNLASSNIS
ncbi:MAG: flagellin FliC, partial [Gammaproteobacteria bacterium]